MQTPQIDIDFTMRDLRPLLTQFHEKYDISDQGCWLWRGALIGGGEGGYGTWRVEGRTQLAHRWAYKQLRGPIPDGLVVDHLCRVRSCVNPDHMRIVTHRENFFAEGSRSPALLNSLKTECKHGHPFTEENTRRRTLIRRGKTYQGRECRTCASESQVKRRALKRAG